jgi:hypothetical protein
MTSTASDVRRARAFRAARAFVLCFSISSCAKRASPASTTSAQPPLAAPSAVSAPGVAMTPSASASAPVSPKAQTRCVTPQSAGVVPLSELKGDGLSEVAAVAAARRELKRVLEIPDDYFGSVQSAGDLVLLELWPRAAFLPENCEKSGERCAKCRTLTYDPQRGRIVSTKVWEQAEDDSAKP